jgi:carotenoid cleavage dioxygenase
MTAHPKIDPLTGEMFAFSYGFGDNKMTYFVVDTNGKLTHYSEFTTPYSSMVHDFIVTSQHVIFPVFPLILDLDQAMMGNAPIAWDGKRPSYIGIMPRDGSVEDIKWIEDDPCYVFHAMNAYTEGDKIVADMMQFEEAPLFPHVDGSAPDPKKAEARLNRWEIDLSSNSGKINKNLLDDDMGEFPRLDERFSMLDYRHGFYASRIGDPSGISWNAIAHHDHRTGNKKFFVVDKEDEVGEPIFVPTSGDAEEGNGFLITLAYKGKENRSDLLIFNAMDVESGPIATAHLPHRVPYGFHGNWRQGEQT